MNTPNTYRIRHSHPPSEFNSLGKLRPPLSGFLILQNRISSAYPQLHRAYLNVLFCQLFCGLQTSS
ncbi:MAG: hypothetical protein H6566_29020 [Lewinellaceae bacterium]|nr:hypothetical protein [Lewinellaceae bacterium]